jgi:hypothetical protein
MSQRTDRTGWGQTQFLLGLAILLTSWIIERGFTEYYQTREAEIDRALSTARSDFLDIKATRLSVDVASFRNEVLQIELRKLSLEPNSALAKNVESLLRKFQAESERLSKKEHEQSQAAVHTILSSLRHLSPGKADELSKEWNDMISAVKPGEDVREALYDHLAGRFSAWKNHFNSAVAEEYEHILRFRWWSEHIFKLLYVIGSALVINGERMRWEGDVKKRR